MTANANSMAVRPCVKCGENSRDARGKCKNCMKVRQAKWYLANCEKVKAKTVEWKRFNPIAPELKKSSFAAYYLKNASKVNAKAAAYHAEHAESINRRHTLKRTESPELNRIYRHNRRAKLIEVGGKLSVGLSMKLFKLQKGKCACCGEPLGDKFHMDHKMPLALGGSNTDDNIQLLRPRCNNQKAAKHPIDFMQQRGFLL